MFKQMLMIGWSISSLSNTLFTEEGIITCTFRVKGRIYWNDARKGENPDMINKILILKAELIARYLERPLGEIEMIE